MSNNVVLDFVSQFMPEHIQYWNKMEYVKTLKLARNRLTSEECENLVLFPQDEGEFLFTLNEMKNNIADVQFILENGNAAYDVLFWKTISTFYPKLDYSHYYEFIFLEPARYKKDLRNCKTIGGCFKKLKGIIPDRYFETQYEGKDFFGEFSVKLDTVHFESRFEKINFSHDEVYLIPYFIEYRNHHLIEWIYQEKAFQKGIQEIGINEICGKINEIAVKSTVNIESQISNRIRKILHAKGYFEDINVEWNHDYAERLISVTYGKKNLAMKIKVTKIIRAYNLEKDLEKLEAEL